MRPGTSLVLAALGWFLLGAVGFFSDFAALIWLFSGLTLLLLSLPTASFCTFSPTGFL
ncbi:MAG: hypothetical protein FWB82_05265 [Treponema sp.]|nr:hypothetical protein [Treponema sp.]